MASRTFLVVIHDFPGVLAKRMEVRPQHLAMSKHNTATGITRFGGGPFADAHPANGEAPAFAGSLLFVNADTRDQVINILKDDIYTKAGVWDVDNAEIRPFFPPPPA